MQEVAVKYDSPMCELVDRRFTFYPYVCVRRIVEAALCVCYEADVCFLVALLCYVAPRLGTSALGNHRSRTLRVGVG